MSSGTRVPGVGHAQVEMILRLEVGEGAATPQAAVSPCTKTRMANEPVGGLSAPEAAIAIAFRQRSHLGLRVHLPTSQNEPIEWRDPSRPTDAPLLVVVLTGRRGVVLVQLVDALWI
jgi:hypothetical protein